MKAALFTGFSILAAAGQSGFAAELEVLTVEEYLGKGGGYSHHDGPGVEARFRWPTGLAVDGAGRAYVADQSPTIRRIDLDGTVTTIAGIPDSFGWRDGVAALSLFSSPRALAVDSAGNIFVSDDGTHTIRKISAQGEVTTVAGRANEKGSANGSGETARFNLPRGLALDGSGNLFVADQGNRQIRQIDLSGLVTRFAGPVGSTPEGLEFDLAGNLVAADWGGGNGGGLRLVSPAGVVSGFPITPPPGFSDPTDVARDAAGNLFVTDTRNECIRAVLTNGTVITFAGLIRVPGGEDGPAASARFRGPRGVAMGPDGSLWVADTENNAIRKLQPDGTTLTVAGLPAGSRDGIGMDARFSGPHGMAFGPDGSLWITDTGNYTIRRANPDRQVNTVAGLAGVSGITDGPDGDARFYGPMGIAVSKDGVVFIADSYNSCIRRRNPQGTVDTFAGKAKSSGAADGFGNLARFSSPNGIAIDPQGSLIVADTFNDAVRKITPDGEVTTLAGGLDQAGAVDGPAATARFREPRHLTVAPDGTVFISDSGNSTIRRISTEGEVSTIAGLAGSAGFADGIGDAARFSNPAGLALDSRGNLYVADNRNRCIRRVTPTGVVTTVAGQPGPFGNSVGTGSEVRFFWPTGLAINANDQIFIADSGNNIIRVANLTAAAQPPLKVILLPASVQLSWPNSMPGIVLEQRNALSSDSPWISSQVIPTVEGGQSVAVIPIGSSSQFFRLLSP